MRLLSSAFLTIPAILMNARRGPTLPSQMSPAHPIEDPEPLPADPVPPLSPMGPVCDTSQIMSRLREPTKDEMREVLLAKRRAYDKLNQITKKLETGDEKTIHRAKLFFGNQATPQGILAGIKLIKRTLMMISAERNFVIDPIEDGCPIVAFALVPPSATMINPYQFIFLRYMFFQTPRHRQGNILIHEASHIALNVEDVPFGDGFDSYGIERAVSLGGCEPEKSVHNADNWALFVDTWPDRRPDRWSDFGNKIT